MMKINNTGKAEIIPNSDKVVDIDQREAEQRFVRMLNTGDFVEKKISNDVFILCKKNPKQPRDCLRMPHVSAPCGRCNNRPDVLHVPMKLSGFFCPSCCPVCNPSAPVKEPGGIA